MCVWRGWGGGGGLGFPTHQPRVMVGQSWRGSMEEPVLWKCGLQFKKDLSSKNREERKGGWTVETNLHSPNRTCIAWLLSGHWRATLARFVQLPVSICQSIFGSLHSRGTGSPRLCARLLIEHGGWTFAACTHVRGEYFWYFMACVDMSAFSSNGMAMHIYLLLQDSGDAKASAHQCWFTVCMHVICIIHHHAEAISANLKTHFWQSNATIKLVNRLRWTDAFPLNGCFVTLDGKMRMRDAVFPQNNWVITGKAELGWRWPSKHRQSPRAKRKKTKTENTKYSWRTFYHLYHKLNFPFIHSSDYNNIWS